MLFDKRFSSLGRLGRLKNSLFKIFFYLGGNVRLFKTIVLTISILASANAISDVIVDTGSTYGSALSVYNRDTNDFQFVAGKFTLSGATVLTDLEGFLYVNNPGNLMVSILSDSNGKPGTELFSNSAYLTGLDSQWRGIHGQDWLLSAGAYWITFSSSLGDPFSGAMPLYGAPNPLDYYAIMNNLNGYPYQWISSPGYYRVGVRIDGFVAPVPIPASVWLFCSALIGFFATHRKFRIQ